MKTILLGSQSPRRKHLLKASGLKFKTVKIVCDESFPEEMSTGKVAEFLAIQKSNAYKANINNNILITADTLVCLDNKIINKPKDENNAFEILSDLSGKIHLVKTGVCIRSSNKCVSFTETSKVFFKELTNEQIWFYIKNYKPFDKAGAYGIQDWIGLTGINRIEGDYFNIMGLPINKVYEWIVSGNF